MLIKNQPIYNSGDKPGKGRYRCMKDRNRIRLERDSDILPKCPICDSRRWEKIV
ncbi:zinc ribbon-containing protein [Methanomicrobium antiquum]|uniref:Zinc ribbon-containing protein n=1 Tax=Methanomicrobium antiquum TaxID=487686 RepID=A0AAF0FQ84_9EURY|nr:hypothetical protein [Methanomicrobium antiquum]WFN36542.1 zinc ribbon-containing protein [Methanomicrobium antiquum]